MSLASSASAASELSHKRRSLNANSLISDHVLSLCQDVNKTITSACAADLNLTPADAANRLFRLRKRDRLSRQLHLSSLQNSGASPSRRTRATSDASSHSRSSSVGSALNGDGNFSSTSHRFASFQQTGLPSPVPAVRSPLGTNGRSSKGYFEQAPTSPPPAVKLRQATLDTAEDDNHDITPSATRNELADPTQSLALDDITPQPTRIPADDYYRGLDSPQVAPPSPNPSSSNPTQAPSVTSGRSHRREPSSASSILSFASSRGTFLARRAELTEDDLDRAARCGRFQERPSDLFLRASDPSCSKWPA